MEFVFLALVWLGCAIATVVVATGKGRNGCLWLFLAVLFGPLALLVAAAMSGDQRGPRPPPGYR